LIGSLVEGCLSPREEKGGIRRKALSSERSHRYRVELWGRLKVGHGILDFEGRRERGMSGTRIGEGRELRKGNICVVEDEAHSDKECRLRKKLLMGKYNR